MTLADAGLKIGDLKKITIETLTDNYGLKKKVAESVLAVISAEPSTQGRQRYLSKVLTSDKKKMDKIEEERFKRQQKDILADLEEEMERLKLAKVEKYRADKIVMNRLKEFKTADNADKIKPLSLSNIAKKYVSGELSPKIN